MGCDEHVLNGLGLLVSIHEDNLLLLENAEPILDKDVLSKGDLFSDETLDCLN